MELPFKIYIFFYKPFASTKQKHLLNSNIWNKFQTSNYLSFLWNFLSNFYFFYKPFASTKQKHLLNSNVWNKFQTSNYLSFLRNFLSKSTFFLQTFCFYEAIFKINFWFFRKANSPTLPFSNSPTLKLSHSQTLPLKINALPANFYLRRLPPIKELQFCRRFPYFL